MVSFNYVQRLYDSIGTTYNATRRADPGICQALAEHLEIGPQASFLDLACGTGNYTCALAVRGGRWHGIDISHEMLEQAKRKNPHVAWRQGCADALPYPNGFFDGVICTLAIHHFAHLDNVFAEVIRVLSAGKFVIFTAFPEQMQNYWLCHYFPEMMARSIAKMPSKDDVLNALHGAGFDVHDIVPFYVTNELQDLFLYSGKERPELYLSSSVRANISSFATLCSPTELDHGLSALRADMEHRGIDNIVQRYAGTVGEYAYVIAHKTHGSLR